MPPARAGSPPAPTELRPFFLERVSKVATLAAVALILLLQLTVVPGVTWAARVLIVTAFGAAWLGSQVTPPRALAVAIGLGPLLPALLLLATGTLNPVDHTVWMAGLLGCCFPVTPFFRWALPPWWRILLGGWALTLALAWPVIVGRELGFDPRAVADTGTTTSWALLNLPTTVSWILHAVLAQLVAVLWLERVVAVTASSESRQLLVHGLWIGATVASAVAVYQGTIDLGFLSLPEWWASLGRATGTMLDANGYGVVAAIGGPLAVVALLRGGRTSRVMLAAAMYGVNAAGVWMSGSRTALLCLALATLALTYGAARAMHSRRAFVVAGIGLVAALLLTVALSKAVGPIARTRIGELSAARTAAIAGALWQRGGYGDVAVRMVREHPLAGVGVGSYNWLAADYWRATAGVPLPFDNAQNWWRHQVAELGVAALPLLIWSLVVAVTVGWAPLPRDGWFENITVRALLIGIALVSLVGMPTQNPVVLIWFMTLVAFLGPLDGTPARVARPPVVQWAWAAVTAVAVAYMAGHVTLARGELARGLRAERSGRDLELATYAAEPLEEGGQFRWTRQDASFLLHRETPWIIVRAWVGHPDVTSDPVQLQIVTGCQTLARRTLRDNAPVSIALKRPAPGEPVRFSTHVSRTWRPSDHGSSDRRTLGAALTIDYAGDAEAANGAMDRVDLKSCGSAMVD